MFALKLITDKTALATICAVIKTACQKICAVIEKSVEKKEHGEGLALFYYAMTLFAALLCSNKDQAIVILDDIKAPIQSILEVTAISELEKLYSTDTPDSDLARLRAIEDIESSSTQDVPSWISFATHIPSKQRLLVVNVNGASKELQFKHLEHTIITDPVIKDSIPADPKKGGSGNGKRQGGCCAASPSSCLMWQVHGKYKQEGKRI